MKINVREELQGWIRNGEVTDTVVELFRLCGRRLGSRKLYDAVHESQEWLRSSPAARPKLPRLKGREVERLGACLRILGMHDPVPEDVRVFDTCVVLGGTIGKMRHRLAGLTDQGIECRELILLTSFRLLDDEEQGELRSYGVWKPRRTEQDAATFVLATAPHPPARGVSVLAAPNTVAGGTADTFETVLYLLEQRPALGATLYAGHQPSGLRQALTTRRAYVLAKRGPHDLHFTFNGFCKPVEQQGHVILDEACRLLWEISQLSL